MVEQSLALELRQAQILHHGQLVLRNGEISNLYVDVKLAYGKPGLLRHMARLMLDTIDNRTDCLAAAGYGGIPLAVAMSLQSDLPLSLARDAPKDHGKATIVDGHVPSAGERVSVVDDVFTTGGSLLQTSSSLQSLGAEVVGCHVVVARGDSSNFALPLKYLLKPEDLIQLRDNESL